MGMRLRDNDRFLKTIKFYEEKKGEKIEHATANSFLQGITVFGFDFRQRKTARVARSHGNFRRLTRRTPEKAINCVCIGCTIPSMSRWKRTEIKIKTNNTILLLLLSSHPIIWYCWRRRESTAWTANNDDGDRRVGWGKKDKIKREKYARKNHRPFPRGGLYHGTRTEKGEGTPCENRRIGYTRSVKWPDT